MTMWQLWWGMKHPLENHPIFTRVADDIYDEATRLSRLTQNVLLQGQVWLWPLLFILDMRLVCLMVFSGTISGLVLTLRISNRISEEQQKRTYDLLCMTPGGTIRTLWAICTGCLHREKAFEILNSLEAWVVRLGLFIPFVISSQLFIQRVLGARNGISLSWGIGLIFLFYIDHIQATVFGCLAGMLAAQQNGSLDKRLWALTTFLAAQVCSYLFTVAVALFILPSISYLLVSIGIERDISLVIMTVSVFYLTREWMITLGWRWLIELTNSQPSDIDFLTRTSSYSQIKLHDDAQNMARA